VVWTGGASVATVRFVSATRPTEKQPTRLQRVRFSFETESLRHAVDMASELRRVRPNGVRVRPAPLSHIARHRWTILVTTDPLEPSAIAEAEEEMRRVAWEIPGLRFMGGLCLSEREPCRAR
jgi:hypothetical protein